MAATIISYFLVNISYKIVASHLVRGGRGRGRKIIPGLQEYYMLMYFVSLNIVQSLNYYPNDKNHEVMNNDINSFIMSYNKHIISLIILLLFNNSEFNYNGKSSYPFCQEILIPCIPYNR